MIPHAARPLTEFSPLLRRNGFRVAPDQTVDFIAAVHALGPQGIEDIRHAALALFAVPREQRDTFNVLFDAHFLGRLLALPAAGEKENDQLSIVEEKPGDTELPETGEARRTGLQASPAERLGHRLIVAGEEAAELSRFVRQAHAKLPRRRSYRYAPAANGRAFDLRRTLRSAVRYGGEATVLARRRRKTRQRRILLLIDVSGSMKERTAPTLRFAHALASVSGMFEAFTLGTRLTRITAALKIPDRGRALARAGSLIADIDGGTRLGDALLVFLDVPQYAGMARGAAVVVLSDGLERGSAEPLASAVRSLSRQAWRFDWLTPLVDDDGSAILTRGLAESRSDLTTFGQGASVDQFASHFLNMARRQ